MQPYFTDLALHPILALGWEQVPPVQQGTLPAEGIENQKEVKVTIACLGYTSLASRFLTLLSLQYVCIQMCITRTSVVASNIPTMK